MPNQLTSRLTPRRGAGFSGCATSPDTDGVDSSNWASVCLFAAIARAQPPAVQAVLSVTATGAIPTACTLAVASNFRSLDLAARPTRTATVNCSQASRSPPSQPMEIRSCTVASGNFTNGLPFHSVRPCREGHAEPTSAAYASGGSYGRIELCTLACRNRTSVGLQGFDQSDSDPWRSSGPCPAPPTHLIAGSCSDNITLTLFPGAKAPSLPVFR